MGMNLTHLPMTHHGLAGAVALHVLDLVRTCMGMHRARARFRDLTRYRANIYRIQGIAWDKIMGRRVGIERLKSMNSNDHHEIPSGNQ